MQSNINNICYISKNDEIPILKFIDDAKIAKAKKAYNFVLGCDNNHLTPFTISFELGKPQIKTDESILQKIEAIKNNKSNKNLIDCINNKKDIKDIYDQLVVEYIIKNIVGFNIQFRLLIERMFKEIYFKAILNGSPEADKIWDSMVGNIMFKLLLDKDIVDDSSKNDYVKNFKNASSFYSKSKIKTKIASNKNYKKEIKAIQDIYLKLGNSLHSKSSYKREKTIVDYIGHLNTFFVNISDLIKMAGENNGNK